MWVKRLRLENFRGFASLDLDLDRPLTVLVGVNGSGKTSVLRAIAATQGWWSSVYLDDEGVPEVVLNKLDLHLGATTGQLTGELRHGSLSFQIHRWWDAHQASWSARFGSLATQALLRSEPKPFIFFSPTGRFIDSAEVQRAELQFLEQTRSEDRGVVAPHPGYARFVEWFKEREDVENERRVAARDFTVQDPQLQAVREVVAALMPGFDNLRIKRAPSPAMVVTKGGVELRLDQLSDGERNLIALAGDLARRMAIAAPEGTPAREIEGVILIDEVEQHLHPAWQRNVVPALQRAFPKAQLIVTTHSPQVLSSVPASSIVVLDGERAYPVTEPTEGRDSNAILREVFGVPERPQEIAKEVTEIQSLIDREALDEARARLSALATKLTEHDDAVLTLRTRLDFAEAGL